jgi:hypothetical protein
MSRMAFIGLTLLTVWTHTAAAEPPSVTERNGVPVIPAVKVNPAPVIDGALDDAVWKEAPSVSGFWCTDLNKEPAEPTTLWLGYDDRNLYFAFYCSNWL